MVTTVVSGRPQSTERFSLRQRVRRLWAIKVTQSLSKVSHALSKRSQDRFARRQQARILLVFEQYLIGTIVAETLARRRETEAMAYENRTHSLSN
jgi:hypothetical protein